MCRCFSRVWHFPSTCKLLDDGVSAVTVVVLLAFFFAPAWVSVFSEFKTSFLSNVRQYGKITYIVLVTWSVVAWLSS